MRNLKTIEKKVRAVLEKNEDARNDDMVLYLALCNACLKDAGAMPLAEIMTQHKYLGLPSFESVSRTRRIADILDVRIHLFAVRRQLDVVLFPQHERQPDLLLNGLDRLTDRALGMVQDLCRLGKALVRNGLTEHLILGRQWYHLFL